MKILTCDGVARDAVVNKDGTAVSDGVILGPDDYLLLERPGNDGWVPWFGVIVLFLWLLASLLYPK